MRDCGRHSREGEGMKQLRQNNRRFSDVTSCTKRLTLTVNCAVLNVTESSRMNFFKGPVCKKIWPDL